MNKALVPVVLLVLFSWSFLQDSCAQDQEAYTIACIAFYNFENLFDTIDTPNTEDSEFTPEGPNQWNSKKYNRKLGRLSEVIYNIGIDVTPDGPAVLGFSEVENKTVVCDLVKTGNLKNRNYQVIHFDSPDLRGIDVGLLYQPKYFHPLAIKSYPFIVESSPDFVSRDQLLVTGELFNERVHFIVLHWPSRYGGEKRSQPFRFAAAELTRKITDSILSSEPGAKIVIMGDFNDNPNDKSITQYLKASGKLNENGGKKLFNPMAALFRKGIGTTAWRDSWSLFDQIMVSYALTGEDLTSIKTLKTFVYNEKYLHQPSGRFKGYPWRTFAGGVYLDGYSDHFPVYTLLVKKL